MMENLAQRVKTSVQLADVLALYHLQPDRAGFLHCPFHNGDRSPSLKVYLDQNTWYCFGCGRNGTVIDFVMQMERCSFTDAIKKLDSDFHLGLSDNKESYRNYRQRLSERRRRDNEQKENNTIKNKIAHRRVLWLKIKCSEISNHDQAQQAASLIAEVDRLDYEIQKMGGVEHWKRHP